VVGLANDMILDLIREKTPDAELRPFSAPQVASRTTGAGRSTRWIAVTVTVRPSSRGL
jgi:hypothetical protein